MKAQHFDIFIQAPPRQVWATMLQSPTYERWTLQTWPKALQTLKTVCETPS